ncbi:hypothetical protein C3L33_22390, partial [Rhododendron williamsianum]
MGPVGTCTAVRRAVVIGNGVAGAENQCIGLVRALGLSHRLTIYLRLKGKVNLKLDNKGVSDILEVDAKQIATMACETFENLSLLGSKIPRLSGVRPNPRYLTWSPYSVSSFLHGFSSEFSYGIYLVLHDWRLLSFGIRDGPLLVVASGWDTISATSSIKRLAPEKVFAIQV